MKMFFCLIQLIIISMLIILSNNLSQTLDDPLIYPTHIHKTLYLDRYFDNQEITMISAASLEWSQATNHIVEFDIVVMPTDENFDIINGIIITKVSLDCPDIIFVDLMSHNTTLGLYQDDPIPNIELVSDRLSHYDYKSIVLHELGHALGLKHNKDLDGIDTLMFPTIDLGADHITKTDLENFCKLYHCNARNLQH